MIQTIKASDARAQWSQLLNDVFKNKSRVIVEKSGIPIAAVISTFELAKWTQLEEQRKKRFMVMDRMHEAFKHIPADEVEKQVNRAVKQVRAERRSAAQS